MGQIDASGVSGLLNAESLHVSWREASWDSAIFGHPVLQIDAMEVRGGGALEEFGAFERARDLAGSRLVSCRLAHDRLRESMLLESRGFRFIEMLYQPETDSLQERSDLGAHGLTVGLAAREDLDAVAEIAGSSFHNERFHVDHRLSKDCANERYRNWARSAFSHDTQRLYALRDGDLLVAFFVTELLGDATCYWHLNAVAPSAQGRGYGRRAWCAMLGQAINDGAARVRSSIVARNHRVLNLYARLGFVFPPPLMTFHWVRE